MNTYQFFTLSLVALLLAGCAQTTYQSTQTDLEDQGRVIFTITDAAADMGTVEKVDVTIDKVMIHSENEGWVTVSSTPQTYDLLALKAEGKQELLADARLPSGTYDQMRLGISKVIVVDNEGEHEAKLPSHELKINGEISVQGNTTSSASFDFIADQSLHVTGSGKYIMAPVVKVETRENAAVEIKGDNRVEIRGGRVKTNVEVGMDASGNVGLGVKIPADVEVSIGSSGIVSIGGKSSEEAVETKTESDGSVNAKARAVLTITDAALEMGDVERVEVTIENVLVHSSTEGWLTLSSTPRTFDLLALKSENKEEILADVELDEGNYNQVRLDISKVRIVDAEGEHEATLPSSQLKITAQMNAKENTTTTAKFDFIADESLHLTGDGEYIMTPVIKVETREDASVKVQEDGSVVIEGGALKTNSRVGMDLNGNIAAGTKIPSAAKLTVDAEGKIKLG